MGCGRGGSCPRSGSTAAGWRRSRAKLWYGRSGPDRRDVIHCNSPVQSDDRRHCFPPGQHQLGVKLRRLQPRNAAASRVEGQAAPQPVQRTQAPWKSARPSRRVSPPGQSVRRDAAPGSRRRLPCAARRAGACAVARAPAASRLARMRACAARAEVLPDDRCGRPRAPGPGAARPGAPRSSRPRPPPRPARRRRGRARSRRAVRAMRAAWSAQTKESSRSRSASRAEVERRTVAAGALGDRDGRQRRRRPLPVGRDAHRRGRIAPGGGAEAVGEAVPDQVQPGAGADLGGDERQPGAAPRRSGSRARAPRCAAARWSAAGRRGGAG